MSAKYRAEQDFKEEGLGQDSNPYNKETQPEDYQIYAWRMHELWSNEFSNEIAASKAIDHQQKEGSE